MAEGLTASNKPDTALVLLAGVGRRCAAAVTPSETPFSLPRPYIIVLHRHQLERERGRRTLLMSLHHASCRGA